MEERIEQDTPAQSPTNQNLSDIAADDPSVAIPVAKLRANLAAAAHITGKTRVVLLATGSYAPVHLMHVEVFAAAKQWLEEKHNCIVVGGWISPSHDDYVGQKMWRSGLPLITAEHRLAMCRLLVSDSNWISVSSWEAQAHGFINFPSVARHHSEFLQKNFPSEKLRLMYIAGADLAQGCGLIYGISAGRAPIPVVAVARPGHTHELKMMVESEDKRKVKLGRKDNSHLFILVETEMKDFSSTQIRKRLKAMLSVEDMCGPLVAAYIKEKNIDRMFQK
jgi:nicotinate (nicotinamide) nucleotide adenylyltransferase